MHYQLRPALADSCRSERCIHAHNPTATLQLLLACLPNDRSNFFARAVAVRDWDRVLRQAEVHGVLGVLHGPLIDLKVLPVAVQDFLEQRRELERLWGAHLCDTLRIVLAAMQDAGVRTIALKGPILAERLHRDGSLRRSGDLDLLVAPTDLPVALRALEALDYQAETGFSARYHQQYHHHLRLAHARRPALELHFRLYVGFGVTVEAEPFFERALPYQSRVGAQCLVLRPEDELLYLSLHAAGHDFARLAWLYDLKCLLGQSTLDTSGLYERAESLGVVAAVSFANSVLQRRLGVRELQCRPTPALQHGRHRLARQLLHYRDTLAESSPIGRLNSLLLQAALCDSLVASAWHLQHHLFRVLRRRLRRLSPRLIPDAWGA